MGPAEIVFPAVEKFKSDIKAKHGLTLQIKKSKIFHRSGLIPPNAPPDMLRAGEFINGVWCPGFVCYGVAIGSDEFVKQFLMQKVESLSQETDKVMDLLEGDNQAAWIILSTALSQQLDYSLTLQYPSNVLEPAALMEAKLNSALEKMCGQHIPMTDEGLGVECVLDVTDIPELSGRSYQQWMKTQPVKLGGLGLRSLVETCPAAFIGGVEMAIPHLAGGGGVIGICPQLERVTGQVSGEYRWNTFIDYNSKTACEYKWAWNSVKEEADNICNYLGIEIQGVLAASVKSSGGVNTDGKTRREITEQREGLRHQLIQRSLADHTDRTARPVTVFQNIADDKVAGRWLLATPGSQLSLSSSAFQEAMSAHLCLPSPAVVKGGLVGKRVGRNKEVIDKFGDAIMNCTDIYGDTWRTRHDKIKQHVMSEAMLSGIYVDCDVYGQFSYLLPASLMEEGGELQWSRAQQGKVPDYKFLINTPNGPESSLAEL